MLIIYVKDYFEKNSETFFKKIHSALKLQNKMGIGMIQVYFNLFLRKYCMSKCWDSNDNLEIFKVTEERHFRFCVLKIEWDIHIIIFEKLTWLDSIYILLNRHLGNFPDTQAFGKLPRYSGIWEISKFL